MLASATPEVVAWAREHFIELEEKDLDFTYSHRKIGAADGGYFRLYTGDLRQAANAGCSHFIVRDGKLVMLRRPGSEKVKTELVDTNLRGRLLQPSEPLGTGWR